MAPLKNVLLVLLILAVGYRAKEYRYDYEWSDEAKGWLKYQAVPATWDEARLRCLAEGAILASPLTNQMKESIATFAQKKSRSHSQLYIFTGVHAIFSKGDYASIEGVPLLRLAITWETGEPDNFENSESCLTMSLGENTGAMADTRCDRVLPYVCYSNDTIQKITECGTTDKEYVKENRTGSCYKYHERGLPWSEAYKTCVAEGGYLAIINNDLEATVVTEIISKHLNNVFAYEKGHTYVGFYDWGHHFNMTSHFMTINGESLEDNYHSWSTGQPDSTTRPEAGGGKFCGDILTDKKLYSYFCGVPTGFLCEKNLKSLLKN